MKADVHASVTRIANLHETEYDVVERPQSSWETGDYVFTRVTRRPSPGVGVENRHGRRVELIEDETLVGALGTRRATLDLVGGWRDVGEDGQMQVLTKGGVLGSVTSASPFSNFPLEVEYRGHVVVDGSVARMDTYRVEPPPTAATIPVVVVVGTSMAAGKTMSARVVTRVLAERGYDILACKLTGAGAYRDILSMEVAGASEIYDFVDAGLPTTVVPEDRFREAITPITGRGHDADVMVAEVGASPLEPYNGATAIELLDDRIAMTVLCASDPYAVVGLEHAYDCSPDLVTGIATNTSAGLDLLEKLSDCPALNLQDAEAKEPLAELLTDALEGFTA